MNQKSSLLYFKLEHTSSIALQAPAETEKRVGFRLISYEW